MTFPRLASPPLIEIPSFALSPEAPVFFNLSLPARSTKCSLLSTVMNDSLLLMPSAGIDMRFSLVEVVAACDLRWIRFKLKTACDLEDFALIAVASVCRMAEP